jgi:Histidine kinase/7TM diverse intracellular signalling
LKLRLFIFGGLLLLMVQCLGQPVELGGGETLQRPLPLHLHHAGFFEERASKMPVEVVARYEFHPFSYYFSKIPKHLPPNTSWWMKFDINSHYERDTTIIFYPGFQNFVHAWHVAAGRFTKVGACGNMIPASSLSMPGFRQALQLPVAAGQISTFYIQIKNVTTYQVDGFTPYLISRASLDDAQAQLYRSKRIPDYFFFTGMGMFLIMLVYILLKWLYQKDVAYLYYALTILGSSAYFLFNFFKEHNNQLVFKENPLFVHLIADSFIFLSAFAYWKFVQKFLYIHQSAGFLGKFIHYGSRVILLTGIISLLYAFLFRDITGIINLNSSIGVVFLLGGLFILIGIRKINQPLRRFVYGGVFSLLFFYALGSLYEFARDTDWNFFPESLGGGTPLLMIGNVLEMLFFTLGLAYRNKLETEQLAKIHVQKAEAEMKALRAQMNPHFIFNCMHTIDAYIFKEQPEKASAFLHTFSKLIRNTLENSQYPLISIDNELESLRLYTALEEERFEQTFTTVYDVSPTLINQSYKIPPLLLQPYVENAIQHGLRHLPAAVADQQGTKGLLTISVADKETHIEVIITDNGVGRQQAGIIKEQNGKAHQSMATAITPLRLSTLPGNGRVDIYDINENGKTGTQVIIHLPKIR